MGAGKGGQGLTSPQLLDWRGVAPNLLKNVFMLKFSIIWKITNRKVSPVKSPNCTLIVLKVLIKGNYSSITQHTFSNCMSDYRYSSTFSMTILISFYADNIVLEIRKLFHIGLSSKQAEMKMRETINDERYKQFFDQYRTQLPTSFNSCEMEHNHTDEWQCKAHRSRCIENLNFCSQKEWNYSDSLHGVRSSIRWTDLLCSKALRILDVQCNTWFRRRGRAEVFFNKLSQLAW